MDEPEIRLNLQKPESRAGESRLRATAKKRNKRDVFALVDARERYCCRCCGRSIQKGTGHHHHVKFLSRGGNDTTANLVLLCAEDHAAIHAYRLFVVGDDANGRLRFERLKR